MKAYHIDAKARTITLVDYQDGGDLRAMVGGWIELAYMWPRSGDCLYVDENGLFKLYPHWWLFAHRPDQALAGSGVVVGREIDPDSAATAPPAIGLDDLRRLVVFVGESGA